MDIGIMDIGIMDIGITDIGIAGGVMAIAIATGKFYYPAAVVFDELSTLTDWLPSQPPDQNP